VSIVSHIVCLTRFHAIMVDKLNGVLCLNEAVQVNNMLNKDLSMNLTIVDVSKLFLSCLEGVEDPEQKCKMTGNSFINVFKEASRLEKVEVDKGKIEWLLQGTPYLDVIESISVKGPSATNKTHHNIGGLFKDMRLKLIGHLHKLFKGGAAPVYSHTLWWTRSTCTASVSA